VSATRHAPGAPVRPARSEREREAALALRTAVFCGEQGVPRELELDERDIEALHLVAVSESDGVVGTCRLVCVGNTAMLGRMAVAAPWRRRGIGAALIAEAIAAARAAGAERVSLHAQRAAVGLYTAAGFSIQGAPFQEAGIEHVAMERALD